jgi:hypothetical protein
VLDHRGFANTCLTADECKATLTCVNPVEQGLQLLECRVALEELHDAALWQPRLRRAECCATLER